MKNNNNDKGDEDERVWENSWKRENDVLSSKTSEEEERNQKKWERDRKRMRDIRLNMPEQEKAAVREYDRTRNRAYEQSLDPEKN